MFLGKNFSQQSFWWEFQVIFFRFVLNFKNQNLFIFIICFHSWKIHGKKKNRKESISIQSKRTSKKTSIKIQINGLLLQSTSWIFYLFSIVQLFDDGPSFICFDWIWLFYDVARFFSFCFSLYSIKFNLVSPLSSSLSLIIMMVKKGWTWKHGNPSIHSFIHRSMQIIIT